MRRLVIAVLLSLVAGCAPSLDGTGSSQPQSLVDRATLSLQEMLGDAQGMDARNLLHRAKGAMICPQLFKAGLLVGGQGGGCVLAARTASGWSPPAFYGLGSGSLGLQAGIQDSQVVLLVLTDRGLRALMDSQFKVGGDASLSFATLGIGVQGSTTAAAGADIVAFARSRGLFAGLSLDGSIVSVRSEWNTAYYGRPLAAQQIVLQGEAANPGAAPLQEMLRRFSTG